MDNLEQVLAHVESGEVYWFAWHTDVVARAREELDALKKQETYESQGLWDCGNCENREIGPGFSSCPNCGTDRGRGVVYLDRARVAAEQATAMFPNLKG